MATQRTSGPVPEPPAGQRHREEELTATVVGSFAGCPDPRLHEVMTSLVRHLHAFVREVRPSEAEWAAGVDFLTRCGQAGDERRQEVVLLSDVLGVSMQTVTVNNPVDDPAGATAAEATEATVLGPFFVPDSPRVPLGGHISGGASGEPCWVEGTVTGTDGVPVAGARVEVAGRRRRPVRRAARRRPDGGPGAPAHRRGGAQRVLGGDPDAVPDPARRAGRRAAGGHRPVAAAGRAPAPAGHRPRPAPAAAPGTWQAGPMARATPAEERDGVRLTHLDDPLFDGAGATKRDLVDYLDAVSAVMLPGLVDRPLSVVRVRAGQDPFMQKNLPKYTPDWVASTTMWAERSRREIRYALCQDRPTLLWLANQRAVEFHVPLVRVDRSAPDSLVIDLDPPEGQGFAAVARVALAVREVLDDAGLAGAVKTSGSKGLHVVVPLDGSADPEQAAAATRALAARTALRAPQEATIAYVLTERDGKVFVDSTRSYGATLVAAYSPRVRPGARVSYPVAWEELPDVDPADLTIRTVPGLLGGTDPWAAALPAPQGLPEALGRGGPDDPGGPGAGDARGPAAQARAGAGGRRRGGVRRRSISRSQRGQPRCCSCSRAPIATTSASRPRSGRTITVNASIRPPSSHRTTSTPSRSNPLTTAVNRSTAELSSHHSWW